LNKSLKKDTEKLEKMDIKKLSSRLWLLPLILRPRQWNERKREKIKILKVTFDN
jgi:hypothetical protein